MEPAVLIIGAGPVGMTAASELARFGIPVRIIDKAAQRTDKSKALVVWSRSLELLERGPGGAAPFVDAGFKVHGVNIVARDRELMGHISMDDVNSRFPYGLMLPQSETERLLEERLKTLGVTVERQVEALEIKRNGADIQTSIRHADGREETVSSNWLLGCDGAHSIVRHTLGVPFSGETMDSDWILGDVHMKGYPYPDTDVSVFWHQDGVFVVFPISPGRYRVIADLPLTAGAVPPAPTLEQVQAIIDRRGPGNMKAFDPIWLAGFRINGRKVTNYRVGNIFLLGDAAHVHSPAGGQGMNTGMQDAFNVSWKLALVIRKLCNEHILESYSPERSKVGDEVLKQASRLTDVATVKNSTLQTIRNFVGHIMLGLTAVQHGIANSMSEVAIGYPDSPLNAHSGSGHGGPKPGERAPIRSGESPIGAGATPRFALFAEESAEALGVIAKYSEILESTPRKPFADHGVWLVRPDGYVALAAKDSGIRDVDAYLASLSKAAAAAG